MKIKDYIVPLSIAFLITLGIQYFFTNRNAQNTGIQSGQTFTVQPNLQVAKPLITDVDFLDQDLSVVPQSTLVDTDGASYYFTSAGACLEKMIFKRRYHGKADLIEIIPPKDTATRENCSFLLALENQTPYAYQLIDRQDHEHDIELTYQANHPQAVIKKHFVIHKATYRLDLTITIEPKAENSSVQPRLIFTSPALIGGKDDIVSGLSNNEKGALVKVARNKLVQGQGWFAPTLFGCENRYFINAMIADENHFAQRGYYKLAGTQELISIIEGPVVSKPTSWQLSFYLGPKESAALRTVDTRLEQTLAYSGLLGPISRILLIILNFFYTFLHNYGLAIILLTLIINLLLWPLRAKSTESMKKYGELQKKLSYIQQRYKNDPEMLAREREELIRKHGMPGLGGCLPNLLLFPILFALSPVLSNAIELYKAPFLWISDLSAKDPYYILPLLIAVAMLIQAMWSEPKQRLSMVAVAIIFGAFSVYLSAGLNLYITVGVVVSLLQTSLQKRTA
jgi:YidC/Oxa1 family membrane protein insertase